MTLAILTDEQIVQLTDYLMYSHAKLCDALVQQGLQPEDYDPAQITRQLGNRPGGIAACVYCGFWFPPDLIIDGLCSDCEEDVGK